MLDKTRTQRVKIIPKKDGPGSSELYIVLVYNNISLQFNIVATGDSQVAFFGLHGESQNSGAKRGVEDALEDINNGSNLILSHYELKYVQHHPMDLSPEVCYSCNYTRAIRLTEYKYLYIYHILYAFVG